MKISIVILNWNGQKMLERFLPSVIEFSKDDAEVIVADNASTDQSMKMLKDRFPNIRTIQLDRNYGFAEGYNQALAKVDSEYCMLLNSDVEVTPHWLKPLQEFMDNHHECAACQPKLLSERDKTSFEYAGACGGFIDKYGYPFCRGRIFDFVEKDNGQYDSISEIFWATGACLLIRKKDFDAVGGLDGRFFAHNEEIDLCWRLRLIGRKIFCIPASYVYHVGGGTLPKENPMKTFLNFRNNLTMLYKNLDQKDLKKVMTVRLFLDYIAAIQTLVVNRNVSDFKAIIRARRAFCKWKKQFKEDRVHIQNTKTSQTIKQIKQYSILWQYYAFKRRRYAELPDMKNVRNF